MLQRQSTMLEGTCQSTSGIARKGNAQTVLPAPAQVLEKVDWAASALVPQIDAITCWT